jgi:hypothetical protein
MPMRRKLIGIFTFLAVVIAVGLVTLWSYRIDLITWGVIRAMDKQGLGPVSFRIDAIGLNTFHASDVSLRNGTIRAGAMTVSYGIEDLLAGRMERVEISGFATELAVNEQGITWDGQPLGKPSATPSTQSPIASIRIDELSFRDAEIKVETASGIIEATVSATLSIGDGAIHGTGVSAVASVQTGETKQALSFAAKQFVLNVPKLDQINATITQASLTPQAYPWSAQGVDVSVNWAPDQASANFAIARLENMQRPALITPIALTGTASMAGMRVELTATGESGPDAAMKLSLKGHYDRMESKGTADIAVSPVRFHRKGLQPSILIPLIGNTAKDVEGTVSLAGKLSWANGALAPSLTLRMSKLSFTTSSANVRDVEGALTLNRFSPLGTPPNQKISAIIETPGIPTANLDMIGQLVSGPALKLQRLGIGIAGGEIVASPFTVNAALSNVTTTLAVSNLDLSEVTKLLSIEGLSGTGRLDGTIPLSLKGSEVAVTEGRLAAREAGVLRYQPSKLPDELTKTHSSVELAFQALTDFHYNKLMLELDKQGSGDGTVMLRLQGQNPAVMSGQPINFNIRVDSNFDRLADYALLSIRSTQELLNRAARRSGQ